MWSHKQIHSEWGFTAQTFKCMHVSFPPKEHDVTKASHSDVASDVVVTWDARHDVAIRMV